MNSGSCPSKVTTLTSVVNGRVYEECIFLPDRARKPSPHPQRSLTQKEWRKGQKKQPMDSLGILFTQYPDNSIRYKCSRIRSLYFKSVTVFMLFRLSFFIFFFSLVFFQFILENYNLSYTKERKPLLAFITSNS